MSQTAIAVDLPESPREALARIIQERGYRKGFVAERAGIPASSLSKILSGTRPLNPSYAVKLAVALEVPIATFIDPEVL